MENKLEELLNSLIEKGWKPRGYENCIRLNADWWYIISMEDENRSIELDKSIRDLTAKESWLWQFCIANHLLKKYSDLWDDYEYIIWRWQNWMDWKTTDWEYIDENYDSDVYHQDESYQRWLIESSLKDESELEEFLLNSIKLD